MQPLTIIVLFYCYLIFFPSNLKAQKQIAITIDDPNTNEMPLLNWQERNNSILETLHKHEIKSALFVCGKRVNDNNGKILLNQWDKQEHLICNHTFSHYYYNNSNITIDTFVEDFIKGDKLIQEYKNYTKLFRFPYLKEGNSAEKRDGMRNFLLIENYKNGHVTIDASDWFIDAEIIKVLNNDINADLSVYKEYYIQHILDRANYYHSLGHALFRRDIKHTLLIHHSLLNALFLDDILEALKEENWILIDAQNAFEDEIFNKKPNIEPCGESIIWQCAFENEQLVKTLRYPAEDAIYEKLPLEKMIQNFQNIKDK